MGKGKISFTFGDGDIHWHISKFIDHDFLGPQVAARLVFTIQENPVISYFRQRITSRYKVFYKTTSSGFTADQIQLK